MAEILTNNWHMLSPPPPPLRLSCISEGLGGKFWEYQKKRDHGVTLAIGGKRDSGNGVGIAWDGKLSPKINTITTEKRWFSKNGKKEDK